jgi:hypothetical protein
MGRLGVGPLSPGVQGPRRLRLVGDVSRLGVAVDYDRVEARARIALFLTAFETPALRLTFGKPSVAVEKCIDGEPVLRFAAPFRLENSPEEFSAFGIHCRAALHQK